MRRESVLAAIAAAGIASTVTMASQSTPTDTNGQDQPLAESTEQVVAAPQEAKAKTVQQKMLAQLRAIDQELHLLNHRTYINNHNVVVVAKRQQLGNDRLRILNQNLFVNPTTEKFGPLSKNGYLGRIAQAIWSLCDEQAVHDQQYGYCSENVYTPPPPGR